MWDWSNREVGTGQTEMWVLAKQNRLKVSIGHTKQTEMWVLVSPNRPKSGYWSDQPGRIVGAGQTKQTEMGVLARPNRPKSRY